VYKIRNERQLQKLFRMRQKKSVKWDCIKI